MSNPDIFDPNYVEKQRVASIQAMAAQQNALRVQTYNGQSRDWITVNMRNRDMGLPIADKPVIPKKITVDDAGNWSEAPFSDLVPPELPAPVTTTSSPLRPEPSKLPPDRTDQIIAILGVLNAKLDRIAAKTGA